MARTPKFRMTVIMELVFDVDAPTPEATAQVIAPTLAKLHTSPFVFGPREESDPIVSFRTYLPNPAVAVTEALQSEPATNQPSPKEVQ